MEIINIGLIRAGRKLWNDRPFKNPRCAIPTPSNKVGYNSIEGVTREGQPPERSVFGGSA